MLEAMRKYRLAISMILSILLILSLIGCKGDDKVDDTDKVNNDTSNTVKVGTGEDSDVSGTGIYGIKTDTLTTALNNIINIRDNLDISTEYSRYNELTDEGYILSTNYTATCIPKPECVIVDANFKLYVAMEYRGDNKYPTSLTVSYDYTSDKDNTTASEWAYELLGVIVNDNVGSKMKNCGFGRQPVEAYTTGDVSVNVSKFNDDYSDTLGTKLATYAVELKKNNGDGFYSELDSFSTTENPQYGLFRLGILSYNEPISISQKRIAAIFSDDATIESKILSDHKKVTSEIEEQQSYGLWEIYSTEPINQVKEGETTEVYMASTGMFEVGTSLIKDSVENTDSETFYINYTGLAKKNKVDAFYDAENAIEFITGTAIELHDYADKDSFEVVIDESGYNESWGYPITASFNINQIATETNEVGYKVDIRIVSIG